MKITLLKKEGRKEVINRVELAEMASAIKNGMIENTVRQTREVYHLMNPQASSVKRQTLFTMLVYLVEASHFQENPLMANG